MADFTQKYRPQKISELDLVSIREGLSRVLKSGKIPQAFLFTGPRGTGKTSAARLIAKSVNCLKKKDFEPCNQCEQCRTIANGTNFDVLEIDAASSRGIDDIRDLREKIKLAPSFSSYKVYIIDEVHMLTLEAFNALLKTLEEPPKHAIFILCTTNPEKLPETIISRCMRFNFKRATQAEIIKKLEKIAKKEKIKIEKEALEEIAKAVKGSFRDANRILEQAAMAEGKVSEEEIKKILGRTLGSKPEELLGFLIKKDAKGAIEEIDKAFKKGDNLRDYIEEILECLRELLLQKVGVFSPEKDFPFDVSLLEIEEINKLIFLFSKAARELKQALIPQLPLEVVVAEYCFQKPPKFKDLQGIEKGKTSVENKQVKKRIKNNKQKKNGNKETSLLSLEEIQNRWSEVLFGVRPKNHSVEALLRATRPVGLEKKYLVIEVFYQFHKDRLEEEKCRRLVEETVEEVFGKQFFLKCILGKKERNPKRNTKTFETKVSLDSEEEDIVALAGEIFNEKDSFS